MFLSTQVYRAVFKGIMKTHEENAKKRKFFSYVAFCFRVVPLRSQINPIPYSDLSPVGV